jgi:transposase
VSDIVANVIVAEIGTDMSRFPTPGHLISWAGLYPRNDESAGKRRSTRTRKGVPLSRRIQRAESPMLPRRRPRGHDAVLGRFAVMPGESLRPGR